MTPEHILRDKLRKIEALFAGAATPGEKAAAGAAAGRIRDHLGKTAGTEKSVELKFSIPDAWSRQLFMNFLLAYVGKFDMYVEGDYAAFFGIALQTRSMLKPFERGSCRKSAHL